MSHKTKSKGPKAPKMTPRAGPNTALTDRQTFQGGMVLPTSGTLPVSPAPVDGQIHWHSLDKVGQIYDGAVWVTFYPAAGGGGGGGGIAGIEVRDEGVVQGTVTKMNYVGSGVVASVVGDTATITFTGGGGGGSALIVDKDGVTVEAAAAILNFTGTPFTVTTGPSGQANVAIAPIFSLADGTRPFTAPVAGVAPTLSTHLTTQGAVATQISSAITAAVTAGTLELFDEGVSKGQIKSLNIVGAGAVANATGTAGLITITGGGGGGSLEIKQGGSSIVATASVIDFTNFDVTESPSGQANVSMPLATDARDGLLSQARVIKMDSIELGSQVNPTFQDEGVELGIGMKVLNIVGPHVTSTFSGFQVATISVQYTGDVGTTSSGFLFNSLAGTPVRIRETEGLTWQNDGATQTVNAKTSGATELTFDGSIVVQRDAGLTIKNTAGTNVVTLTPTGATELSLNGSLKVPSLTAGRCTFAGTGGLLSDDADYTFSVDTLTVTKLVTTQVTDSGLTAARGVFAGTGGLLSTDASFQYVTGTGTLTVPNIVAGTTLKLPLLTTGRVVFAASGGQLVDDADFTFGGDTLSATKVNTSLLTGGQVTASSLIAGRVTFAGTGGLLSDDADFTFATDTLTATKIVTTQVTDSGLTATRVLYAGAGGLLSADVGMTYVVGTGTLSATNIVAATSLKVSTLTSGRVPFITTSGQITDSGNLLWLTGSDTLKSVNFEATTSVKVNTLGPRRLTYTHATSGILTDSAELTYNSTTKVLSAPELALGGVVLASGEYMIFGDADLAVGPDMTGSWIQHLSQATGTNVHTALRTILGGYTTGSGARYGHHSDVNSDSTGNVLRLDDGGTGLPVATVALLGVAENTNSGATIGGWFRAKAGTGTNIGVVAVGRTSSVAARAMGIVASASGPISGAKVAGWFTLSTTDPTPATSAALVADNGSTTANIFEAIDGGTTIFAIVDGGNVDFSYHQGLNFRIENKSTAQVASVLGRIIYRTDLSPKRLQIDNGVSFDEVTAGASHSALSNLSADDHTQYSLVSGTRAYSGNLSMGSNKITNLATPTTGTDAANKNYADDAVAAVGRNKTVHTITSDLTATDSTLTVQRVDYVSFSSNYWTVGNGARILAYFSFSGAVSDTATIEITLYDGTTSYVLFGQGRTLAGTSELLCFEAEVFCRSDGVSGSFQASGRGGRSGEAPSVQIPAAGTLNSTVPTELRFNVLFSSTTGKSIVLKNVSYEVLAP